MPGKDFGANVWNRSLQVLDSCHFTAIVAFRLAGLCCLLVSPALAQTNQAVRGYRTVRTTSYPTAPTKTVVHNVRSSRLAMAVATESKTGPTLTSDLQQIMLSAMAELDAGSLPEMDSARAVLERELEQVNQYIEPETPNGQAWSRFLQLDAIREEMKQQNPNPTRLAQLEVNLQQNYPGLESDPLLDLRSALRDVKRAARYGSNPDRTIQVLNARMQALVKLLDENPDATSLDVAEDVGRILNYLYESNQAPSAVSKLRGRFSMANAEVYASEALLNQVAARGVAEPSPVDECILGTRILGRACLQGSVAVDLLPMHRGVSLNLNLSGNLTSQNRGYNRGVVLRTSGTSPVFASKPITVTPEAISAGPSSVSTNLRTTIHRIEHRSRLVRKIAKKKAAQQKPQADAIAQGRHAAES